MRLRITIYLIGFIFLFSCKNSEFQKKDSTLSNNEDSFKPTKVIVTGTTDDPSAFKYFNWMNFSYIFGKSHEDLTKKISNDSLFLELDSIKQPQLMNIIAFGDSTIYRQTLFVTPGDSISITIRNKKITVKGGSQTHAVLLSKLDSLNFYQVEYEGNLNNYKEKCKFFYDKQVLEFNKYVRTQKNMSDLATKEIQADLDFSYYAKLMFIRLKNENRSKTVLEVLRDGNHHDNETIFNLKDYFNGITFEDIDRPDLLNNSSFKNFFSTYVRSFLLDPNLEDYSNEKFLAEKDFLLANFKGELQHFGIVRLINDYNNFAQTENVYNLKTLIQEYKENLTEPSYLKKIEEIENELALVNNLFSKEALNAKLLSLKGDTLLFKEVLKLTKSNIKAIDFWASWCAPCINEVVKGYDIRKEISNENNIEWLYFSIDENKEDWIKKSMELDKYGLTKNQYLILNHKNSGLSNFLNVYQIPRYVILDKNDLIRNGNAPRPTYEVLFKELVNTINNN